MGCKIKRGKKYGGPCETLKEKKDCRLCEFFWEKRNTSSCVIKQADEGWIGYMIDKNCDFSDVGIEVKGKLPSTFTKK